MFINPKIAIEEGWIEPPTDDFNWEQYVQPNAIDFTIDKLFTIQDKTSFIISETGKQMRGGDPVQSELYDDGQEYWELDPNTVYDFMSNFYVKLPEGVACELIIRSTFNRNGIFLTSGLYDSGFQGNIAGALHNRSGKAYIAPGTRVGQIKFVASDGDGTYAGQYCTENGQHWSDAIKEKK